MPVTRSELLYFSAGIVVGAVGRDALPKLKEKFGPILASVLAGATNGSNDVYADLARTFSEKVENVQDTMAEMKTGAVH